ncbi:copper homeostasis membrane protein CopD [Novosphingobium sp. B1]|uniref:copper homeostasis membrane protein CopD n=1 Tax=Novosphingobium sp. B1 TaxID=1938756 RepID=UPI001592BECB|nr:copper homeostasis membrane protein CopD [Novosphingobium sp. B1]
MESSALIAARALSYVTLLLVAGLPLYALANGQPVSARARGMLAGMAVAAAAASAWWALESIAAMAGMALSALDQPTAEAVLAATPLGAVMEWRLTALAAVVAAAVVPLNALRAPALAVAGSVALCSIVFTGHAGASEAALHRWADGLHLLAAALWLGALAAFLAAALRNDSDGQALARFARTGSVVVAVLVLTGAVNTLAIAGWPIAWSTFAHSRWAALLVVKLTLFIVMLALAAGNRWLIVPAFEQGEDGAQARLRRAILAEFAVGLAIVVIVAALGVLDPAA